MVGAVFAGSEALTEIKNRATHVGFSCRAFSDGGSTPPASIFIFLSLRANKPDRHCEARSATAIHGNLMDCFAALAMTEMGAMTEKR